MAGTIIDRGNFRVKEYLVKDSTKTIFIFTAMGTKISLYRLFVSMLNQKGYSCVVYDYPIAVILDSKIDEWEQFFDDTLSDARTRLAALKADGATDFFAYGVSMGTLLANKFTRDNQEISHLILNLTYGNVADNVWTWRGVKKAKENVIAQGLSQEELREAMTYIDPIANAAKLKGRKIMLYLSRTDRVLIYEQTQFTKKAFEAADLDMEYVENKYLGHFVGAAKNMLAIRKIDTFYKTPNMTRI